VRPQSDASALESLGAEIVQGDLRELESLRRGIGAARTVITTATSISRSLAGDPTATIAAVDERGNANLVHAAEEAGVERFVFVSFVITPVLARAPLAAAKRATEERLARSRMRVVIVRPEMFQEIWLSRAVGLDWDEGKARIFGKGETPNAYVAVDDVAEATVRLALADDPPHELVLAGSEALTRKQVVERFEQASGRAVKRRHIPRAALRVGSFALRRLKPVQASLMALALDADVQPEPLPAGPLRNLGIEPRPAGAYIDELATGR
jgi:NADH dehydrogenase